MTETEPFKVGQSVIWHQGEEMGHIVSFGTIKELKGPVRFGTLVCEFPDRDTENRTHEFHKANGISTTNNGYIRLT